MPIDDDECSSPPADEGEKLDIIQGSNKTVNSPSVVLGKRKRTDPPPSPSSPPLDRIIRSNKTGESPPSVVSRKSLKNDQGDDSITRAIIPWELHLMSEKLRALRETVKLNKITREVTNAVKGKNGSESESDNYGERQLKEYEDHVEHLGKSFMILELLGKRFRILEPRHSEYDPATASPSIESHLDRSSCLSCIDGSNETMQSPSVVLGKRKMTDEGDVLISGAAASKIIPWQLHLIIQKAITLREIVKLNKISREVTKAVKRKNDIESELENYGERQLNEYEDRIRSLVKGFKNLEQLPRDWEYHPDTASTSIESDLDPKSCLDSINGSNKTVESPSVVSRKRKKTDEGDVVIDPMKALGMNYTELMKDLEYKNVSESELVSEDKNGSELEHLDSITGSNKSVESVESTSAVLGNSKWAGGFYLRDDEETKHELLHTHETEEEHENAGPNWFYRDPDGEEQGPVSRNTLKSWSDAGYFAPASRNSLQSESNTCFLLPDTTVWRVGQTANEAILLREMLSGKRKRTDWGDVVIDLSDDEDTTHDPEEEHENAGPNWFYRDPQGIEIGPVSRNELKEWFYGLFICPDTTVWRVGQTPNEAILLRDMLVRPSIVLGKRKRTDEGDGVAASNIIPMELHLMIQDALKLRDRVKEIKDALEDYRKSELDSEDKTNSIESDYALKLRDRVKESEDDLEAYRKSEVDSEDKKNSIESDYALKLRDCVKECEDELEAYRESELDPEDKKNSIESDYYYSNLKLERCEDQIRNLVKRFKKLKQLPRDWEYDPDAANTFVPAKPVISALADMSPPRQKRLGCWLSFIDPDQKFPKTMDVPLDEEEEKIWRDFKEFDKNHWQNGLTRIDFNIVDKYKRPLLLEDPIVGLTSKFAVTAFNEAIEMYVKKGEQNNIHDVDVVECKYLKMRGSRYYFFITIDAFEERIRGVYDATVRLEWDDGSKSLMQFILTDRKPHDDNKTMKLMKLKTHPGSWRDGSHIPFSGMRPRRRKKKGICRGYDYVDPYRRIVPP